MAKVYPEELIGQELEIITSQNPSNQGLKGKIVDETKHTIKIIHQGKIKTLLKSNLTFRLKGKACVFVGKDLVKRPEERIKGR